jgi:general secretion pathway protein N
VTGIVLGAVLTLLVFAPASWLASAIQASSGEKVLLVDARGTIWSGSAQLVLTGGIGSKDRTVLPGLLQWRLSPVWAGLNLEVSSACCTPRPLQFHTALQWGGFKATVMDGDSSWPAGLLTGLGTPWNTMQPEGVLRVTTSGFSATWVEGRLAIAGQVTLDANNMSSRLSTLKPMGSYRLTVLGGAASTLQLQTLDGSLQLSGNGEWVGSKLRFTGEATAAPDREAALSNLLNLIGRRTGARSVITVG